MSDNGSGVYVVNSTGQPVVASTLIDATVFNAYTADAATAMSTRIAKDGQTTITADIPFNAKKITGLAAGTARTDAASLATIQDGTGVYIGTVGGTADAITLTASPAITVYVAGMTVRFIASGTNTTTVTAAANGLAAKAVTKNGTTTLAAGDITSGQMVEMTYDGTRFVLVATSTATLNSPTLNSPTLNSPIVAGGISGLNDFQGFRLSLTTGLPVTIADVTAAGTLYAIPYTGTRVSLYSGTAWIAIASTEFSLALTLTSGNPYDVFCYSNAGVPTLEVLVWTNDTTRATALAYQDGILVKSGTATRRYLGTLYASGTNTTEDSFAKRYLWNYYHRVERPMKVVETTNSWTYTTATWRQANGAAANQLDCIVGVEENPVEVEVYATASHSNSAGYVQVGIGLGSTTVNSATVKLPDAKTLEAGAQLLPRARYVGFPGVGRRTFQWLEYSVVATNTTTWYGDTLSSEVQSGILGLVKG